MSTHYGWSMKLGACVNLYENFEPKEAFREFVFFLVVLQLLSVIVGSEFIFVVACRSLVVLFAVESHI